MPTGCQGRQKRRSSCYLADCDLLSVDLTKNNKITSLPHSSSQGKNQSTPCFTVKRLGWQIDILGFFFFFFQSYSLDQCDSLKKKTCQSHWPLKILIAKNMQYVQLISLPTHSEPFHVRGRFELLAGCMGKKGRGLVKKRQQATEMHNPTRSGLTSTRMQYH